MAYVALFVALAGVGYAATVARRNSVVSRSIKNGQVKSADVRDQGLRGVDVKSDSLGGGQIDESSLAQVPEASSADHASSALHAGNADRLAGLEPDELVTARSATSTGGCGATAAFDDCVSIQITLPRPARLLVMATGEAVTLGSSYGECLIEVDDNGTFLARRELGNDVSPISSASLATTDVSGIVPTGDHHVDLSCRKESGTLSLKSSALSVVALGAG